MRVRQARTGLLSSTPAYSDVTYFSWIGPNLPEGPVSNATELFVTSHSDDGPLVEVPLPWVFPLLGADIQSVWVSPNGVLFDSRIPPVFQTGGGLSELLDGAYGVGLNLSSFYYGCIAPFATDLYPFGSPDASVGYYSQGSRLTVRYSRVPLYYNISAGEVIPGNNSFRASLHSDGHLTLHYDSIVSIRDHPQFQFFSGLRDNLYTHGTSATTFTSSQLSTGLTDWGTSIPGMYPPLSAVSSGNQFTMCPVSTVLALSPAVFDSDPLSSASPVLMLTPLSLSCLEEVEFSIFLEGHSASSVSCQVQIATAIPDVQVLSCDASIWRSLPLAQGMQTVIVSWSSPPSNGTLNLPPLLLNVSAFAATHQNCTLNSQLPFCDACDISRGNFSCLHDPCGSVYRSSSCSNDCSFVYSLDFYGECCPTASQDCAGTCQHKAVVAKRLTGEYMCCDQPVDCLGICGGLASLDCSGVCNGDSKKDNCGVCNGNNLTCTFNYSVSVDGVTSFPINITPSFATSQPWMSYHLKIWNNNNTSDMLVTWVVSGSALAAPSVHFSSTLLNITALSKASVMINISNEDLYQLRKQHWEVKRIILKLYFDGIQGNYEERNITIFPTTRDCNLISIRDICMSLPGCIFCLRYPSIRMLQEIRGATHLISPLDHRKLFIDIVPPSNGLALQTYDDSLYGTCTKGWLSDECTLNILNFYSTSGCLSIFHSDVSLNLGSIMIILMSVYFYINNQW